MSPELITVSVFFLLFLFTILFGLIEGARETTKEQRAEQEKADAKKLRDMEKYCELGPWNPDLHDPWHPFNPWVEIMDEPDEQVKEQLLKDFEKQEQLREDLQVIWEAPHV